MTTTSESQLNAERSKPSSSQPGGPPLTTSTIDDEDSVVECNEALKGMLTKDWDTLSLTDRIRSVTETRLHKDPKKNVKHAALWGTIASLLFRNGVPGSEAGETIESPHAFSITLREWKKCVDDGYEEVVKIVTTGDGFEDDGVGGLFGQAVVGTYRLARDLAAGKPCTGYLPAAMLYLEQLRRAVGGEKDDSDEKGEEAAEVDGKGKAKEIVVAQSSRAIQGGARRKIKLPFGNVKQEELPDEIDGYIRSYNVGPVDKMLRAKDGEVVVPEAISTYVPPSPADESKSDPDGHTIWMTSPATKARYFSNRSWPKPLPKIANKIVVKTTDDGSGMGVFATRDIKRFEPVLVERPYLVYPRNNVLSGVSAEALEKLSDNQIAQMAIEKVKPFFQYMVDEQMTSEAKKGFMSLANSHTNDGSGPTLGIVRTNGFGIEFGQVLPGIDNDFGMGYSAVGNIGSRFNHSCIPDVTYGFEPSTFTLRFTAIRDIKKGSQIYATYTPTTASKAERQKALAPYGFECACRACVNATPQSDKLRQVCHTLTQKWRSQAINVWSKDPKLTEKVLIPLLETKRRMEEEGLDTEEAGYYTFPEILYRVYSKVGNRAKTEEARAEVLGTAKKLLKASEWMTGEKMIL